MSIPKRPYSRHIAAHDRIIYDIYDDRVSVLIVQAEEHSLTSITLPSATHRMAASQSVCGEPVEPHSPVKVLE